MQRKLFVCSVLLFIFALPVDSVFAQDYLVDQEPTPVLYEMPYPGLLPTNSFYFLKVTRDNLFGFFLSDPVKKAEYFVLQSDKRVETAYILATNQPQEPSLIIESLEEAVNYFSEALRYASNAKRQGMDVHEIHLRMRLANLKHQERTNEIIAKFSDEEAGKLITVKKELTTLEKQIHELVPEEKEPIK